MNDEASEEKGLPSQANKPEMGKKRKTKIKKQEIREKTNTFIIIIIVV